MKRIERVAALGTVCLLLAALMFTFNHWTAFEMKILKAPFIPVTFIQPLTILVPVVEILIITLLLIPKVAVYGWRLNIGLQIMLSIYLVMLITESTGPPCGCGGIFPMLDITQHLYLQIFLLLISLISLVMTHSPFDPRPVTTMKTFSVEKHLSANKASRQ